jgi:hypothetical protein
MPVTNSSFLGTVVAILKTTMFNRCSMCDTHTSLYDIVVTPLKVASLHLPFCSMGDTNSTLLNIVVTPLEVASLHLPLCTMRPTNASFL